MVDGLDIQGSVTIAADNVTLKNCKISDSSYDTVLVKPGVTGAVVQNCDIDNQGSGGQALAGQGTFLNNNIHGAADGIDVRGSNTTIKDNFIHDLQGTSASHFDGVQADGNFSNFTMSHNTVINDHGQTSALMLSNYWGPIDTAHIDNNLLVGGGYTTYLDEVAQGQPGGGTITGLSFTNNHLGTGQYGTMDLRTELGDHPTISGNVNDGASMVQSLHMTGQPSSDGSGATASTGSSGSTTTTGSGTSATDGSGTAASGGSTSTDPGTSTTDGSGTAAAGTGSTSTSHDPGTSTTDGSGTAASGSGSTSTSHDPGTSTTDGSGTAASGSGSTSTPHDPGTSTTDGSGTAASGSGSTSTSHDPGTSTSSGSGSQSSSSTGSDTSSHQGTSGSGSHHWHHHTHQSSVAASDPTAGQTASSQGWNHDSFNFGSHCSHAAQALQSSGSQQGLAQASKSIYDHFADALNHASQAAHGATHAGMSGDTMTFKHGNTATQHHNDMHLA